MVFDSWTIERVKEITEIAGTPIAILFTGIALHIDAVVRRAQTNGEIAKRHFELWTYFYSRPTLAGLRDRERDLIAHPLTDEEVHFVNFLLLHLRETYYASRARIYRQPECLGDDIREFLSYPTFLSAWERLRPLHDRKFVRFVERNRAGKKARLL